LEQPQKFDVIVIDGALRAECAKVAREALTPTGIIIYDNTDGEKYAEGRDILMSQNFRRIDFFGFGPIWRREWSTAVFYRDGNCVGI
jgi:hypothetical protein